MMASQVGGGILGISTKMQRVTPPSSERGATYNAVAEPQGLYPTHDMGAQPSRAVGGSEPGRREIEVIA